jgi:hypothetical protein
MLKCRDFNEDFNARTSGEQALRLRILNYHISPGSPRMQLHGQGLHLP